MEISYVTPLENYLTFEARTGTKCQLHSQGKLTMARRENGKIHRHENIILKANEHVPYV
jgi:hypothetical protein